MKEATFNIQDALDIQTLLQQRSLLDRQLSDIINRYGIENANIVQDNKGRWVGLRESEPPTKLQAVPQPEPEPEPEILATSVG